MTHRLPNLKDAVLVAIVLPIVGCATNDTELRGNWDSYTTLQRAQDFRDEHNLKMDFVDNRWRSMGDTFSEHSLVWLDDDYDGIAIGKTVAAQAPDGKFVMHRVKAGSSEDGWLIQGTHNDRPDGFIVTRSNYRGTYVGQLVGDGQ